MLFGCTGRSSEERAYHQSGRRSLQPALLHNDAIVSLSPQGTEILFALGLGGRVVGVTDTSDWPPEATHLHAVSRCRVDSSKLSSAEVEQQLQMLKAEVRDTELEFNWLQAPCKSSSIGSCTDQSVTTCFQFSHIYLQRKVRVVCLLIAYTWE